MAIPDEKHLSNIAVDLLASVVLIGSVLEAYSTQNQDWLGVGAGALAICSLLSLFVDYFSPPSTGDVIHAPNKFARLSAGILGIMSGVLWILSAWPGLI
jgi:hypothetical protein